MKNNTQKKKKKEPASKKAIRIIAIAIAGIMVVGMAYYAIYMIVNGI